MEFAGHGVAMHAHGTNRGFNNPNELFTPAELAASQIDEVVKLLVEPDPRYEPMAADVTKLTHHRLFKKVRS